MAAIAAARKWWARRRAAAGGTPRRADDSGKAPRAARAALWTAAFLGGAIILCAAIGFAVTEIGAGRLQAEQHVALQRAVDEFSVHLPAVKELNEARLQAIARHAGLSDLRVDSDPPAENRRELQSLVNARGRIVGWFSWTSDRALADSLDRLWGLLAAAGGVCMFGALLTLSAWRRGFLLRELESAVAREALEVHYQPVVAAEGGALIGVEALLRWIHAERGDIAPSIFIPLAEEANLMPRLGAWVLRRALSDAARWPDLSVAVNLSPLQIRDPVLVARVGAILTESGIAPERVVLEVTEGVLIDDPDEAQARLAALCKLGVSIALDDFGTGYSSLSYLQKFPFQRLKIDRAFVASLGEAGNAGAIIQSIVTLGHALGMKVLAEGIENDEQRVLLRLAGCDEMQGFLFARPGPAADIDALRARSARAAAA